MRHRLTVSLVALAGFAAVPRAAAIEPVEAAVASAPAAEDPVLSGVGAADPLKTALERLGEPSADPGLEFEGFAVRGLSVQGPGGEDPAPGPLAAEIRSRIDRFDVAAGLVADPLAGETNLPRWTGRIGLASERGSGRESLELRTTLDQTAERSLLAVEIGPRLERRLRRGVTFFIDGKAEARAERGAEQSWWSVPGGMAGDGLSTLGVAASTGIAR